MKKAIIIGGGFTGFTWAHLLAQRGWQCLILEKEAVPGGGIRTLRYGGHPYTHGPRHFIGNSRKAFEYANAIVPQRILKHCVKTYVAADDQFYTFPPHEDDIPLMPEKEKILHEVAVARSGREYAPRNFEEAWIGSLGDTLYRKLSWKYTMKHWQIPSTTLIDNVGYAYKKIELRSGSHELEHGSIVSYPVSLNGWDDYFSAIASEPGIQIRYNVVITAYDLEQRELRIGKETIRGDLIVSTISPDILCGNIFGPLPYVGRTISPVMLPVRQIFPDDIYFLYYAGDEPYARIVEYKKLTGYEAPNTLLGIEYPSRERRDYPYPFKAEMERADRYISSLPDHVVCAGTYGRYRYKCMSDIIEDAWEGVRNY